MSAYSLNYTPPKTVKNFMLSDEFFRMIMGPVGCLPAESEFLTPTGWKRMDSYEPGDLVAQWTPEGVIEFVAPDDYIVLPQKEPFHRFSNVFSTDMVLSDEHRVVFYDWKGALREETAEYIANKLKQGPVEGPRFYVPVTFRLPEDRYGISLSDVEIRLMVAVHADGHFPKFYAQKGEARCVIVVRKERKKVRLREILAEAGIPWDERTYSGRPTETQFHFTAPRLSKKYDAYWWGVNQHQAEVIYNEFKYWDGLIHPDGEIRYSSVHLSDVEYMQFICHATGHRATLCKQEYDNPNWNTTYYIQVTRRLDERVTFRNCEYSTVESTDGLKYCFSVPSTYFMARHSNRIFVTGNSGKSVGCCIEILRRCIQMPACSDGIRRSRWCVTRNTAKQLRDTTLKTFFEWIKPGVLGTWRESDMMFIMQFNDVRAEILFRPLDTPDDVQRVLSLELTGAYINEANLVPVEIIQALMGRIGRYPRRSDVEKYWCGLIADTNPPEIDSDCYKLLERLPLEEGNENSIIQCEPFFQPSGLSPEAENIENLRAGYYENLAKGKTQRWIDTYIHVQYQQSQAGKPVYHKQFKSDKHVAHNSLVINPTNPVIVGVDFGRTPACTFKQYQPDGRVFVLRECVSFDVGLDTFISRFMKPMIRQWFPNNPLILVIDPSGKNQNQSDDNSCYKTLKKMFKKEEGHLVKAAKTNDPVARINATGKLLSEYPDGEPQYLIDPSCKWLIAALRSKYRYMAIKGSSTGLYQEKPEKNEYSHITEANQYSDLFINDGFSNADYIRTTIDPFTHQTTTRRAACSYSGY